MKIGSNVRTCLWFDREGDEAAKFYVSLLPNSRTESISRPNPNGVPLVAEFTLADCPFMTLNGGPRHKHSPAASISMLTRDQAETDALWSAFLEGGGEAHMCAWLIDRFGVSWQIVPEVVPNMMSATDKKAARRAREAMLKMKKMDIAALEAPFRGD